MTGSKICFCGKKPLDRANNFNITNLKHCPIVTGLQKVLFELVILAGEIYSNLTRLYLHSQKISAKTASICRTSNVKCSYKYDKGNWN